jgi:hypothetical protein
VASGADLVDDLNEPVDHDEYSEQKHHHQQTHRQDLLVATGQHIPAVIVTVVHFALLLEQCVLVGWFCRSVEGLGQVGDYYFFGGLLLFFMAESTDSRLGTMSLLGVAVVLSPF